MLICHQHRFVFIKTRKTAGTSAEIALSRLCGPGDVITPLARVDEELRRTEGGYPPSNWAKPVRQHRGFREWRRLLTRGKRAPYLDPHATAKEVRSWVRSQGWDTYFTFTIERNPWDRAVSLYWWMKYRWENRGRKVPEISEALRYITRARPHLISNWDHYAEGDRILVDRILFYERLQSDLDRLRNDLGIEDIDLKLPQYRAKGGHRSNRQHYSAILSADDRALIGRVCRREIEAFGYEFEPSTFTGTVE